MAQQQYTTKEAVENYLVKNIDGAFDVQITEWIKAMSKHIDSFCDRIIAKVPVGEVTEIETYKYDGDNTDTLFIKDCTDLTEVKVDDVVVSVLKYPANKTYTRKIKLADTVFTKGLQNVEVTGIQAMYKVVPDDIKFACTVLVGMICNNQVYKDKGTTERIGNYSITYTDAQKADFDTVKSILSSYKMVNL